jgi:hypothetical protein
MVVRDRDQHGGRAVNAGLVTVSGGLPVVMVGTARGSVIGEQRSPGSHHVRPGRLLQQAVLDPPGIRAARASACSTSPAAPAWTWAPCPAGLECDHPPTPGPVSDRRPRTGPARAGIPCRPTRRTTRQVGMADSPWRPTLPVGSSPRTSEPASPQRSGACLAWRGRPDRCPPRTAQPGHPRPRLGSQWRSLRLSNPAKPHEARPAPGLGR